MKTIQETRNDLLNRTELVLESSSPSTGIAEATKSLSEHLKTSEESVVIKRMVNSFGSKNLKIEAFVYDSKEFKDKIEPKVKEKKGVAQ